VIRTGLVFCVRSGPEILPEPGPFRRVAHLFARTRDGRGARPARSETASAEAEAVYRIRAPDRTPPGLDRPADRIDPMAIRWAGSSPALLLRLDRTRPEPLRLQLETALRDDIRAGRLGGGERLPSSRELAREVGVSRGVVLECYGQLRAEGYLSTRGGSGTHVALTAFEPLAGKADVVPLPRLSVDFRPGHPDLTSFPRSDWSWALREACRTAPSTALGYGDPRGSERLREILAAYFRRVRGMAAEADQIIISAGVAQGLNLVLRALAREGVPLVALEDPGDPDQHAVVRRAGLQPVLIPVDANGIVVEQLAATKARAVVLTPAHQMPTGVVLSPDRRRALLAWASERDAIIIEDDYDAEFRFDGDPIGALQGFSAARVATIGSVSKTLAPTLRLGWVVCPPRLAEVVADEKRLDDRGSPGIDELALALLIESGRYDRHLRRMRTIYSRRRRALGAALARHAPDIRVGGLAAGFHAVAYLPPGLDEKAVIGAALERSIGLYGMSDYRANRSTRPPALVLGYGDVAEEAIERGILAVRNILQLTR
jgi:GntR family transcriptional regulator/MocR family aminotransferase